MHVGQSRVTRCTVRKGMYVHSACQRWSEVAQCTVRREMSVAQANQHPGLLLLRVLP